MSDQPGRGRPSVYTEEIADEICAQLAAGESLNAICADERLPHESTVRGWAVRDYEGFFTKYAKAREVQADRFADEMTEIADAATSKDWQVAKLRVDTRKWITERILPRRFGNRATVEHTGEIPAIVVTLQGDDG